MRQRRTEVRALRCPKEHNIEFSCTPESLTQSAHRERPSFEPGMQPGRQLQRFVRWILSFSCS
jgi:hypothetical protein